MANKPSHQIYPGDFWREPGTRGLSCAGMGAYSRLFITLLDASPSGELHGTHDYVKRICGASDGEWARVLGELQMSKIFDIDTNFDDGITVISRRLVRERKEREATALRQENYRKRKGVTEKSRKSNAPSSSSSSSSSSKSKSKRQKSPVDTVPEKQVFGEHQNVLLTEIEYGKLRQILGGQGELDFWIEKLSGYVKNKTGKPYKSHYAVWSSWGRDWWLNTGQRLFESTLTQEERTLRSMEPPTEEQLALQLGPDDDA